MNKFKHYSKALRATLTGFGFALIFTLVTANAFAQSAQPDQITPPVVPGNLVVEDGNEPLLLGHATGTQNYVCKPVGAGFRFVLFTPEATLAKENGKQIITHFFSPNPFEPNTDPTVFADGTIRAAWQAQDTSTVWAKLHQPNGAATVDPNAIAWLLLDVAGVQNGPTGGDTFRGATFVQRVNTTGGLAPSVGCTLSTDVGNQAFVPYTADYFFYRKSGGGK
jgi:Protein of unknown function (DUF3455)